MDINTYYNLIPGDTPYKYGLGAFNVQERFAPMVLLPKPIVGRNLLQRICRRLIRDYHKTQPMLFLERGFAFQPLVFSQKDGMRFEGNWCSEKYFLPIADAIRKEITLKPEFSAAETKLAKEIISGNSVSLHIRRGDYVQNAVTASYHGICTLGYYSEAMRLVASKVNSPHIYVFSDDIEWVKTNLKVDYPVTWVSNGVLKDYEELMLMSYCRHNIIANSTFSWWGAWLNSNPNKMVVAPKRWFAKEDIDTKDLIPETWIRI